MTNIKAIKTFFEADGGRRITMDELKPLTSDDKAELGRLCRVELGVDPDDDSKNG